jgi:DNA-binding beta-propeller fold protein YncE
MLIPLAVPHRRLLQGRVRRAAVSGVLIGLIGSSCDDGTGPARDRVRPVIEVRFPTSADAYDEDGDGLVDLRIAFHDSAGAVAPARLILHSVEGVDGGLNGRNLLEGWTVEEASDSLLVVHETVENLLPSGANRLVVWVPDTAGNIRLDTIGVTLPAGALHTTIITGVERNDVAGGGMMYCPDDHRLYLTTTQFPATLVIIEPDSLTVLARAEITTGRQFGSLLCVLGDPMLYMGQDGMSRYNRAASAWATDVAGAAGSLGMAVSRRDSNLVYVGEVGSGTIGIIDRALARRTGRLLPISMNEDRWVDAVAVLPDDATLYASVWPDVGLLIVDPWTDVVRDTIDLALGHPSNGYAMYLRLSQDATRLYVAVTDGPPAGVWELDTRTNQVLRIFNLNEYLVINLALSPDERRIFVTTQDRFFSDPSQNVLLDVETWTELARFPRPRPLGDLRWDQQVTFHPSGKLVFVSHNQNVDVYLNRR